jgi:hypothetical protein
LVALVFVFEVDDKSVTDSDFIAISLDWSNPDANARRENDQSHVCLVYPTNSLIILAILAGSFAAKVW